MLEIQKEDWVHCPEEDRVGYLAFEDQNNLEFKKHIFRNFDIYYFKGHRHRLNGPAFEWRKDLWPNRKDQWYYMGKFIECSSQEEFERIIKLKAFW